jgi:hypothetical protein
VVRQYLPAELEGHDGVDIVTTTEFLEECAMGFGRGLLLWLLGIPLPIIILLAIFMHH